MLGWGRSSSRAARVTHSMSSVFHYSREKPKPSNQNKTRTMKSTGEEGSPTRESLVCGICLAKAFYRQGISETGASVLEKFGIWWKGRSR